MKRNQKRSRPHLRILIDAGGGWTEWVSADRIGADRAIVRGIPSLVDQPCFGDIVEFEDIPGETTRKRFVRSVSRVTRPVRIDYSDCDGSSPYCECLQQLEEIDRALGDRNWRISPADHGMASVAIPLDVPDEEALAIVRSLPHVFHAETPAPKPEK